VGIAAAAALFIAYETLLPSDDFVQNPRWCIVCGYFGGVSFILNVVLFVPFGFGLRLAGLRRNRTIAAGFLTSLAIELLQFRIIPGRESGISDLISNTLGAIIGAALAAVWRTWLFPDPRMASRLTRVGALAWLAILGATAWALQPSSPAAPLRAFWIPELEHYERFSGRVLSASLNGVDARDGELPHSDAVRRDHLAGRSILGLAMVADRKSEGTAPILGVWDAHWTGDPTMAVLLSQQGAGVTLWLRMRSSDARLRNVILRLDDVLSDLSSGALGSRRSDTVYVRGAREGARIALSARVADRRLSTTLPLSATFGWNLLLPFDYPLAPHPLTKWLTALWVAGLVLPIGYWASRAVRFYDVDLSTSRGVNARERLVSALTLVAMVIAGLLVIPLVSSLAIAPLSDWLAALIGLLIGWTVGSPSMRKTSQPPRRS
jgi:VanZ family protein